MAIEKRAIISAMNQVHTTYSQRLQFTKTKVLYGLLVIAISMTSKIAMATVDVLYVNHITKELNWSDSEFGAGWIGWESLEGDPSMYYVEEEKLINKGYEYTSFPMKIESLLIGSILLVIVVLIFLKKREKTTANNS